MTRIGGEFAVFQSIKKTLLQINYPYWKLGIFAFIFNLLYVPFLMMASDKTTGHMLLIDQSDVAYGGILNELSATVKVDDADVARVIEFAIEYGSKNRQVTVPQDNDGKAVYPVVSNLKKLKLQATLDGKTQHHLVETSYTRVKESFQRRKLIYGITYSFSLSWSREQATYRHNFVVSLDRARNMYMFGYTFTPNRLVVCTSDSDTLKECRSEDCASKTPIPEETDELAVDIQSECRKGVDASDTDQSQCQQSSDNLWKFKRKHTGQTLDEAEPASDKDDAKRTKFSQETFSIVTQNIWNFNGIDRDSGRPSDKEKAYIDRVSQLGELLESVNADIVGLQEVRFDVSRGGRLGPCQVQQLAQYLPNYQFVYQPAVNYVGEGFNRSEEGLAIFSLHPIVSHDFILLSRDLNDDGDKVHQRICLHAEIDVPSFGKIHVFVTHLSLSEAARQRSVVEIWDYMSKHSGPAVLIGDLNDYPDSQIIRFLSGNLEINRVRTEGLQDAWLMKNKEPRAGARLYDKGEKRDVGLTFSTLERHLSQRIDYIFIRLPEDMQITGISLVDDQGRGPMAASDHLGLQASITKVASESVV